MVERRWSSKTRLLASMYPGIANGDRLRRECRRQLPIDEAMERGSVSVSLAWDNSLADTRIAMEHPDASRLGLITSVVFVGGFVGAFLASPTSDYLGRRYGMLLGSSISLVGTVLQTAAQNSDMFITGRFFVGLGISFTCVSGPPLLYELSHPSIRATITSTVRKWKQERKSRPNI